MTTDNTLAEARRVLRRYSGYEQGQTSYTREEVLNLVQIAIAESLQSRARTTTQTDSAALAGEAYAEGYENFRNKWIGDQEEMCADLVRDFVPRTAPEPDNARLLREFAEAEAAYRLAYQLHGRSDIKTGRAWDRMRRAGDAARQALASTDSESVK